MGKKRGKFLIENEGENILKLFRSKPEWEPTEVPYNAIRGLGLVRQEDTLSIWVSGSCNNPLLAEVENAIAGIDVLAIETNPNITKNEPSGNAYHYILQKTNSNQYPFILYGPYKRGTIISHWYDTKDLDVYLNK